MRIGYKRLVAVGTPLGLIAAAGIAFAAWTATGEGNGTAKAGEGAAVIVAGGTVETSGLLYPNGTGDAVVTVTNPNPYPVTITAINGNGVIKAVDNLACKDAEHGVKFTNQSGTWNLAASGEADDSKQITLSEAVSMSIDSDNACQDTTFTVPVTVVAAAG